MRADGWQALSVAEEALEASGSSLFLIAMLLALPVAAALPFPARADATAGSTTPDRAASA